MLSFNPHKINKQIQPVLKTMCIVAISHSQAQQTCVNNRVHCERTLQIITPPNSKMKSLFLGSTINRGTYFILSLADPGRAPFTVLVFIFFSAVPNCFKCRQYSPFTVFVFNIFSAVPNRFKSRQNAPFTVLVFIFLWITSRLTCTLCLCCVTVLNCKC